MRQKSILLSFIEAVDLINKDHRATALRAVGARLIDGRPNFLHPTEHRRHRNEMRLDPPRDQLRDGGFACSGRAPQYQRMDLPRL